MATAITIREVRPGEGETLARIAEASPGAARWIALDYEPLAHGGAHRLCLVADNQSLGAVGFIVVQAPSDEAELLNLAVFPELRRQGIARLLLQEGLRQAAAAGARRMWLEVRESNHAAIGFYRQAGFEQRGRRRNYYRSPAEDALVFARDL